MAINTEKMLEKMWSMVGLLPEGDREYIAAMVEKREVAPSKYATSSSIAVELIIELQDAIRADGAKKVGKTEALRAAKRVLSNHPVSAKPAFGFVKTIGEYQYFTDGYRGFKLKDHLPLPELPEGWDTMDLEPVIANAASGDVELELPDLGALKAYIKMEKARLKAEGRHREGVRYDFGPGLPLVNAEYLADMLILLPGCKARVKKGYMINPLFFESDGNSAVLLPVRPGDDAGRVKTQL